MWYRVIGRVVFSVSEEHDHLIPEGEGNTFLQIAVNHLHSGTASYCSRLEYLVTPLWKSPNPQLVILSHFKRSYKCREYLSVFVHPTPGHYWSRQSTCMSSKYSWKTARNSVVLNNKCVIFITGDPLLSPPAELEMYSSKEYIFHLYDQG